MVALFRDYLTRPSSFPWLCPQVEQLVAAEQSTLIRFRLSYPFKLPVVSLVQLCLSPHAFPNYHNSTIGNQK
jgi:hypothetical protein